MAAPSYRAATVTVDTMHNLKISSTKGSMVLVGATSGPHTLGTSERRYRFAVGSKKKPLATAYVTVRSLPTTSEVVFTR